MFRGLTNAQLNSLSYGMNELQFSRQQVIYTEGHDQVENIYLVKSGEF